jgi:hypothetical protein
MELARAKAVDRVEATSVRLNNQLVIFHQPHWDVPEIFFAMMAPCIQSLSVKKDGGIGGRCIGGFARLDRLRARAISIMDFPWLSWKGRAVGGSQVMDWNLLLCGAACRNAAYGRAGWFPIFRRCQFHLLSRQGSCTGGDPGDSCDHASDKQPIGFFSLISHRH